MKKFLSSFILAGFLGGLVSLLLFAEAKAQLDFFTFFIPYPADILDDQFDERRANPPTTGAIDLLDDIILTTISISIHENGTLIYYDHWEDGVDPDSKKPTQTSTEIWGDGIDANGKPPGFSQDILNSGSIIVLRNEVPTPRDENVLLFDGGDKLVAEEGPIAVTLAVWPIDDDGEVNPPPPPDDPEPGIRFAGAWELYPTNKWGFEYIAPIGENLAGQRAGFSVVGLNVQAAVDNTQVNIDINGDNIPEFSQTLNQGENFTRVSGINSGTRITADGGPIQVHIFSSDPARSYEARAYTLTPIEQWGDQLLAPRSTDGDFWIYNRHTSPLTLTVRQKAATDTLIIPPQSTGKYPNGSGLIDLDGTNGLATGLYFSSTDGRDFYGIAALDQRDAQDWGYAVLPVEALSSQTLVGWGIGNNNSPPGPVPDGTGFESRIYVTALQDTVIYADYDNNPNTPNTPFPVSALEEVEITDPDYDLTGTFLYTEDGTEFLAVWGQDEDADPRNPSIDVGTSLVPFPSLLIQKTVDPLVKDIDCTGTTTVGDTIRYRLKYFNSGLNDIEPVFLSDDLPGEVEYIEGSTTVNGNSISDVSGNDPFPLATNNGYSLGTLERRSTGEVTFDATVINLNFPSHLIVNQTVISSTDGGKIQSDFALIFTPVASVTETLYELDTKLVSSTSGQVASGDTITLSLTITNTGSLTITSFPLEYLFDESYLTFEGASPEPNSISGGILSWTNIISSFGNLTRNQPVSIILNFIVRDNLPPDAKFTTLEAAGTGKGQFSDGSAVPACSDARQLVFGEIITPTPSETPNITSTPDTTSTPINTTSTPDTTPTLNTTPTPNVTPTPNNRNDDNGNNTPAPPPSPPGTTPLPTGGTPVAEANPNTDPSPPLPVILLPETGLEPPKSDPRLLIILFTLGGSLVWLSYQRRK